MVRLRVSALDSASNGPGSSPGRGTVLCPWARYCTLIEPLSTQVYKRVPANLLLGVNPAMDHTIQDHPGASRNTPIVASCYRNRDKLRLGGSLGSYAGFNFFFTFNETLVHFHSASGTF